MEIPPGRSNTLTCNKGGHATGKPRKIGVVTVARSDFGIYEPVIDHIKADPLFDLHLMATGAHFAPAFGRTVTDIEEKGLEYVPGLEMLLASDSSQGVGKSLGLGIISFAQAFAADRPDLLVVLGDRVEMLCGPVAALAYNIPVAHIHGGAVTEGAIDELVRHAITKMSHLHFVSCDEYAHRVIQMGEEPWRVHNVGAPGLDRVVANQTLPKSESSARVGMDLSLDTLLATYHPVTLELGDLENQVDSFLTALESSGYQIVITYPNSDEGSSTIIEKFHKFSDQHRDRVRLLKNAGTETYLSLMAAVSAMVGNSSSGIVEAPSFHLPVVNIGTRQQGKLRAANVIDVGYSTKEIAAGIQRATSKEFAKGLLGLVNPYGDGHAGRRIVEVLRTVPLNDRLLRKKFVDLAL